MTVCKKFDLKQTAIGFIILFFNLALVCKSAEVIRTLPNGKHLVVLFGFRDARHLLQRQGYTNPVVTKLYRDSLGTKFFIQFREKPKSAGEDYRTAVISSNGVSVIRCPIGGIFDDAENLAYWKENTNYVFRTRAGLVNVPTGASGVLYIQSEPAREYVAILNPTTGTGGIRCCSMPQTNLISLPAGFQLSSFFFHSNSFFLFGKTLQAKPYLQKCLIFRNVGGAYQLDQDTAMPWAGTISDFDPVSQYLKVDGRSDLLTMGYLFNLRTKGKISLGWNAGEAFFLQEGVAKALLRSVAGK